ncbi:MAG: class I SAM-dependent methyltransferase [Desulfohalobiaceae bacterium]
MRVTLRDLPNPKRRDPYYLQAPLYALFADPILDILRRRLQHAVLEAGCSNILDLGCGTGRQCRLLEQQGLECLGLDCSWAMLRMASKLSPASSSFVLAQAWASPFPASSFDGLILCLALHEMPPASRLPVLTEAARLLKPWGRLFILDFEPPGSPASRIIHCGISIIERLAGKRHFQASRDFLRKGGLQALISQWPGQVLMHQPLLQTALSLYVLDKDPTQT